MPPLVPEVLYQEGSAATRLTREIEVPAGDRLVLQLGPDVIGLGADSRLVVEEAREALTRLRLEQGGLAARVGAGGDEERFVVLAGEVTVESAEGRFGVFRDGDRILVRVREGRVRVRRGAEQWSVGAGRGLAVDPSGGVLEVLEEGEDTLAALLATAPREAVEEVFESPAPRPPTPLNKDPAPPPLPTVPEARARLLGGDQEGAVAALEARLEVHPTETDSWQLLATAHRRSGDRPAAAVAWEQVRRHGAGAIRAQAAYELAVLHQDTGEHGTAAELLAGLVDDPDLNRSLRPDAAVRLGRSQLALGQTEAARATLTGVVEDFPGTQPAATASGLLGGL